jgi:hypothetical protein
MLPASFIAVEQFSERRGDVWFAGAMADGLRHFCRPHESDFDAVNSTS